ncbi:lipid droplet assembly factor 1 isoform X1 [Molossus molossus]|uniref:lipid droplet assembly factor 1 isoform X1 n=2 Tax=Molossus molossus TaxID=27622 RepID=UPI001747B3A7|nr:lipid droplet assembly factor 1 isoform X1 [Molossus molossus]
MAVSPAPCHPETPPRPGKPVTTRDWVTGAIRLRSTLESLPVEELIPKSLKCCRMAKEETPSISKDLQELWRKLSLLIDSVQNNSKILIHGPWDGFGLRDVLATDSQDDGAHYQSAKSRGGCLYEVSSGSVPGQAPFCSPHFAGVRGGVSGSGWVLPAPCGTYLPGCVCGSHITGRTGHLRGRPLPVLCPLWLGLRVTRHFRDHHRVLRGGFQPHQPLVFFRTTDTRLQRGLPTDCEARGLGGALPGMSRRRSCSFPPGISGGWDHTCLWGCDSEGTRWSSTPWGGVPGFFTCE